MPSAGSVSTGENIIHVGAVRLRCYGAGNLQMQLTGLDAQKTQTLQSIVMSATPRIEPTKLANFINQRVQIELKTTAINEVMNVTRIILFTKPIYTSFPG